MIPRLTCSDLARRRLVIATAAGTLALTAVATAMVAI
jgi:hypothetical protein